MPIPGTEGRKSQPAKTHIPVRDENMSFWWRWDIASRIVHNFMMGKESLKCKSRSSPVSNSISKYLKEGVQPAESKILSRIISSPLPYRSILNIVCKAIPINTKERLETFVHLNSSSKRNMGALDLHLHHIKALWKFLQLYNHMQSGHYLL